MMGTTERDILFPGTFGEIIERITRGNAAMNVEDFAPFTGAFPRHDCAEEEGEAILNELGYDKDYPHRGYLYDRTRINHWEKAFADSWEDEGCEILNSLWDGKLVTTPLENFLIATFVQWLGTNVGCSFLQHCLNRCGAVIHWPKIMDPYQTYTRHSRLEEEPLVAELIRATQQHDAEQLLFDLSEPH